MEFTKSTWTRSLGVTGNGLRKRRAAEGALTVESVVSDLPTGVVTFAKRLA
jgi:hypothetical protein